MASSSSSARTEPFFNVHAIKLRTKTEGPFVRCCIWFQGCDIHCPLCCNGDLLSLVPKHILPMGDLLKIVRRAKRDFDIEGVTFSGGEPSLQQGLPTLCQAVHAMGLGIILFSGRYKEQLPKELVANVDLLLEGPFQFENKDERRLLIGSTNKRITPVTDRYRNHLDYFDTPVHYEEIVVDGDIFINGD